MNAAKKRSTSNLKALAKKNKHKLLTFWRIVKYGVASFSRNAWLSLAATAIMIITLLIISVTLVARTVLSDTINDIKDKVDMSIYVDQDISSEDIKTVTEDLKNLANVKPESVRYISPEDAKKEFAANNSDDPDILAALNEATNMFPGIFNLKVIDINDVSELENYVDNNDTIKNVIDENYEPSFSSSRRAAIENIARTASFAEKAGLAAGVVFVVIASLIIFNTIRMAIFNRREEIYMMKLIGANKSFIRGPFIVEASQYGFIASIVAFLVLFGGMFLIKDKLVEYGIAVQPTIDFITRFWPIVVLGLMAIGIIIGVISSLLATRKYLKLRD